MKNHCTRHLAYALLVSTCWYLLFASGFYVTRRLPYAQPPSLTTTVAWSTKTMKAGQVLIASSSTSSWFDTACVAYPLVIPPWTSHCDKWKMIYYGHGNEWKGGHIPLLPSGWVGLAESSDGLHWERVEGKEEGGSILSPSNNPDDLDHIQIGHGDVVIVRKDYWVMFYFGAGESEPVQLGSQELQGFRMRVFRAVSRDQGLTWQKLGMVLDVKDSEGWFASWPRVIVNKDDPDKPWQMIYHSFNGVNWRVYGAYSHDEGKSWVRHEKVLLTGTEDDEEAWDFKGVGTRSVVPWKGGWLMIYEAVDKDMKHRLGTAFCKDPDGAGPWQKSTKGPFLEPGVAPLEPWTSTVVGTPYAVPSQDGKSLWLYYVGRGNDPDDQKHAIGLLISESGELEHDEWEPITL